jgi:hypothetical protein
VSWRLVLQGMRCSATSLLSPQFPFLMFLIQGVVNAVRGERLLMWVLFLCMPFFATAIVIVSRRTLKIVG